jgi:integrase
MGLYVKIMLYCGLRTMEVAALDGRHIDRMNRLIHVRQNVGADGAIKGPKTDSGIRDVPIPEPLLNALSDVKLEPYQPVFVNANGKRVDRNWIQTRWTTFKQCMLSDGCTSAYDLVPYDLRHTYCTDLQTAGVPINIAKELMGHSSISVTANIYTHTSAQSMEDAADRINNLCQNRDITRKVVGK